MENIAIIGIGCRFPDAESPESFWHLLRNGLDVITEVPSDRWDIDAFYDPKLASSGKMNTRWGGFLENVAHFDPSFFGISSREAKRIDPQQRVILEVAWEALENSGIAPKRLAGSQTGVFIGISNYDYGFLLAKNLAQINAYDGTGNAFSIAANRLSYMLDLHGPSVAIDTACSSSLVAVHFACQSLQSGESNLCLVGGVNLILSPESTITFSQARMMAPDGRCKTFDAMANGYVRGEGCGVVVLKRLSDALQDEDNILALIRGCAVNQDGLSNGLTAPNSLSQQAVIRQALENSKVAPSQISYVEVHGTGTSLGDPIEVSSLKAVLMKNRKPDESCWLGSLKTNIGHLEAAAGIASLIKVVLSLQHREIPPHLHLKQLNPYISLEDTTFSIPTECQPWFSSSTRLAGISSFGFGGTNCHMILEEALVHRPITSDKQRPLHLATISAKSEKALRELAKKYADFLETHPETFLADICFTTNTGRSHFDQRLAVIAESTVQLCQQLSAFAIEKETSGLTSGRITSRKPKKIAFLFTGQGSQYVNMGRQLYETEPTFRNCLEQCNDLLHPYLQTPLLEVLYPANGTSTLLNETAYTQPALFALEYSLAELWKSWGIEPTVVMGHSVGEYVAACVAGVFSLEDGLKLIAQRARLMQALPQDGDMVAVLADEQKVIAAIQPYTHKVGIAAINGAKNLVISGESQAIRAVCATLEGEGVKLKPLQVSHAFHSSLMKPMIPAFEQVVKEVTYSLPRITLISNVTGQPATTEMTIPEYWCCHVQQPVKFAAGMETLYQQGCEIFVEIGPKPTLLGMGRECLPEGIGVWLPSLRPKQQDCQEMLQSLGQMYVQGVSVDWLSFHRNYPSRRVALPTYPWQRSHHWLETSEFPSQQLSKNVADGKVEIQQAHANALENSEKMVPEKIDNYFYKYQWKLKPRLGQQLAHNSADYLPSPQQIVSVVQPEAIRLSQQQRRKQYYEVVEPQLNVLCAAYILQALQQLGWQPQLHQRISAVTLAQQLGVVSQHKRLLERILEILHEDGLLSHIDDQWEVCQIPQLKKPQKIWRDLIAQHPAYQAELILLERCGTHLAEVLRGKVDPLGLIFPEGSLITSEHLYQDSPSFRIYNLLVQKAIATALKQIPTGRVVRILEIGAGTGSLTSFVLPKLPTSRTEYVFTDVSQMFTAQAEQKFHDYPFVEYKLLDIEVDPRTQGFEAHSFDIILASDALHATSNLRQTLENVKQLLASEGLLVLLELTKSTRLDDLVFGLLKGWWLFSDLDLRSSNPLLSFQRWRDLLTNVGFIEVAGISDTEAKNESLHTVILAQGSHVPQKVETFSGRRSVKPVKAFPTQPREQGSWLIFADREGVGQQIANLLKEVSQTPILIFAGAHYERIDTDRFKIRPDAPEDLQKLLEAVLDLAPCQGIIHLWSLDASCSEQTTVTSLESDQTLGCLSVLNLVQGLVKLNSDYSPRLFLVTCGTQTVGDSVESVSVAQSPLWGLSRVLINEQPKLHCKMVDLGSAISLEEIQSLFDELWVDDREDEIALRGEARYINRLIRVRAADLTQNPASKIQNQDPFHLENLTPGILDNLTIQTTTRQKPAPGEVEIQVCASGLNFKDVMAAMAMVSDEALEGGYSGRFLGMECAGIIVALGAGVEGFQVGDEVIAIAARSLGTHTTTDARFVVSKPALLSFEEAATIPVTFLTAYYSLHYQGRISKGDRVLIHTAAGGVGLAAIQIAQQVGAEIFATAGTEEKRDFLRSLGVEHVMDSRSLTFAEEVIEYTGGKGVNIILNSLTGEAIAKSLSVLGKYGRFVEIGKWNRDRNSKLNLQLFPKNLSFFTVDIDQLAQERPDFINSLLREVMQYFEKQIFHPLTYRVFPISQVVNAFRHMTSAKHIGKIVVSLQDPDVVVSSSKETLTFRTDATYLITGGLGGFGLVLAQWLVEHGARHLVLMGRSGASSSTANSAIEAMREAGAQVVVAKADVSQAQQVKSILANIEQSMPPLRGIVHAAMILDDDFLLELNRERFQKVMAPKLSGAWNLHTQTLNIPLDFFVLFSSVTSILGNPKQGNYAAASAFLDALAHYRHKKSLPALSVNWGVLGDIGYVAQNTNISEYLKQIGVKPLLSQQALNILGELLPLKAVQMGVLSVDWQHLTEFGTSGLSKRFSYLVNKTVVSTEAKIHPNEEDWQNNAFLSATPAEREHLLLSHITQQVSRALGVAVTDLDIAEPLTQLGLDSLMVVELTNKIKSEMGITLSTAEIMQGLSISQLVELLLEQLALTKIVKLVPPSAELTEETEEITL